MDSRKENINRNSNSETNILLIDRIPSINFQGNINGINTDLTESNDTNISNESNDKERRRSVMSLASVQSAMESLTDESESNTKFILKGNIFYSFDEEIPKKYFCGMTAQGLLMSDNETFHDTSTTQTILFNSISKVKKLNATTFHLISNTKIIHSFWLTEDAIADEWIDFIRGISEIRMINEESDETFEEMNTDVRQSLTDGNKIVDDRPQTSWKCLFWFCKYQRK